MEEVRSNGQDHQIRLLADIISCYQKNGRKETLKRFKISDPKLYGILHTAGIPLRKGSPTKARRGPYKRARPVQKPTRYPSSASPSKDAPTAPNSGLRGGSRLHGVADAIVYLKKVEDRLVKAISDPASFEVGPTLGLISLAIEALTGKTH